MPNVILTGFMATGKTSVGRRVAMKLGLEFIDTDQEVEKVTGLTIKEIFQRYGETRFRSEESAAVKRVAGLYNKVISTGGGVVLNPDNMTALAANGLIINLEANPQVIMERVSRRNTRPLLQEENPLQIIINLIKERQPFYEKAAYSIDTSNLTLEQVVDRVVEIYFNEVSNG